MSRIGGAYYELSVESSKFTQGLKDAEQQAKKTSNEIEGGINVSFNRMSIAIAGATAAATAIVAVIDGIRERLYDGAVKAEEFGQKLNLANAQSSMRALNDEIARLQMQLGSQSGVLEDFAAFIRGDGASFQLKDQIKELEAIRSIIDNRLQRQRDEATDRADAAAEQKRLQGVRREYVEKQQAFDQLRDIQNRQSLEGLNDEERARLETEIKVAEYRRRLGAQAARDPQIEASLAVTIENEYRIRDQKLKELNGKRQDEAMRESAKIMADAMKQFAQYVDKLERIQQSWDEGFNLINGGQDLKRIGDLLQSWGPSIRSM